MNVLLAKFLYRGGVRVRNKISFKVDHRKLIFLWPVIWDLHVQSGHDGSVTSLPLGSSSSACGERIL